MSILDVDDAREPSHLASEADLAISNAVWPARSRTGHITAAYRRTHSFRDAIQNHLRSGGWHTANAPDRYQEAACRRYLSNSRQDHALERLRADRMSDD